MKHFSLSRLFTAALLSIGVSLASVSGIALATQGHVGGGPARPDENNPRTQSIFIHELDLGESAEDTALVINNTDEEKVVRLYAVDGIATNTGALTCKQLSEDKTGAGKWLDVSESEVTLAPKERKEVDFTITVPEKADVGEHNACLVYQVKQDDDQSVQEGGVSIQTRSATRVAVTIPGDLKKELILEDFAIDFANGRHIYKTDVANIGNVSVDALVGVTLRGMFGDTAFEASEQFPMVPRVTQIVQYKNDSLPLFGGFYTAEIKITYDKRPGIFNVPLEDNDENLITLTEEKRIFIMPHPLLLAAVILLLFAGLLWALWLIAARKKVNSQWEEYTVKKNDTVQSIAQARETSWKKLARVNSLKAPYALEAKTKLLVPKLKNNEELATKKEK